MTRPSRPRRSAPVSYAQFLQPIDLGSSSESDSPAASDPSTAKKQDSPETRRIKRLKKRKASYIPEQDSGSDFELAADKDGARGGAQDESEEEEDDDDAGVSEDAATPDERDMSDILSSGGTDEGSPRAGKHATSRRGPKAVGRRTYAPDEGGQRPASKKLVVHATPAASSAMTGTGGSTVKNPRARPPARLPPNALDQQYSLYGPNWFPPTSVRLSSDHSASYSTAAVEHAQRKAGASPRDLDAAQTLLLENWTANPFAPERRLVEDLGWNKGKWKADGQGGMTIAEKWGGWYNERGFDRADLAVVTEEEVASRLPEQIYHSRPDPFDDLPEPSDEKVVASNVTGTASTQVEIADQNSDVDEAGRDPQEETEEERSGRRTILVGGIDGLREEVEISLERFESAPLSTFLPQKPGHLLNVGGPVAGLAWLPRLTGPTEKEYLAVSTSCSPALVLADPPDLSSSRTTSMIQIWALSDDPNYSSLVPQIPDASDAMDDDTRDRRRLGAMRFELGLLIGEGEGEARDLEWCPRGGHPASRPSEEADRTDAMQVDDDEGATGKALGMLAGVFTDGKVKVFLVPLPEAVAGVQGKEADAESALYARAKKVLELGLPETSCLSFAWGSGETIAAGCMNGSVAVWHVGDALRRGLTTVRPTHYVGVHSSAIRSITFITTPPLSTEPDAVDLDFESEPHRLATASYDGSTSIVDLRESGCAGVGVFLHERCARVPISYSPHAGCLYADDQDDRIRAFFLRPTEFGGSKRIGAHRGTVWSIATSAHHPFVVSAASDGNVLLHSGVRALRRRRIKGHFSQRVYSVDFDREEGKFRMRDNWQIEHRIALDSIAQPGSKSSRVTGEPVLSSTSAWPAGVELKKVCWHPNLERSALVASGGNWGCVRIDWVEGTGQGTVRRQKS
ncbi:hypothetical protein JCM10212_000669 [Sporobolomyces blumeae]